MGMDVLMFVLDGREWCSCWMGENDVRIRWPHLSGRIWWARRMGENDVRIRWPLKCGRIWWARMMGENDGWEWWARMMGENDGRIWWPHLICVIDILEIICAFLLIYLCFLSDILVVRILVAVYKWEWWYSWEIYDFFIDLFVFFDGYFSWPHMMCVIWCS
jgi:hypothetical protein